MSEIKSNLYPCKHCGETGTCTSGEGGVGCAVCMKNHELKKSAAAFGITCGSCGGLGLAETRTERMHNRLPTMLAIVFVMFLLIFTFMLAILENKNFPAFLAFSAALLGSIVTFYFSRQK
jgi:hypothetical protein